MPLPSQSPRTIAAATLIAGLALVVISPVTSQPPKADRPAATDGDKAGSKVLFDGKSLDGWKPSEFFGAGKVRIVDSAIVMEQGKSMTGITFAGKEFPRIDYEVTLEGKKLTGDDFFCTTTFPVGKDYCSFVVGGWGGSVVGLSSINSQDASSNETSKSMDFKRDKWYRFRIRVSQHRIETWIDDEKMVDVDTSGVRISTRIECRPSQPFGIATYETAGAVRNIRVRSLSEAEKKAAEPKKPDDKN
jgi:3-keto-disaccharide hydrolase